MDTGFQGGASAALADIAHMHTTSTTNAGCIDMAGKWLTAHVGGCGQGVVAQYTAIFPLFFGHVAVPVPEPGGMASTALPHSRCGPPFVSVSAIVSTHAENNSKTGPETLA